MGMEEAKEGSKELGIKAEGADRRLGEKKEGKDKQDKKERKKRTRHFSPRHFPPLLFDQGVCCPVTTPSLSDTRKKGATCGQTDACEHRRRTNGCDH